MQDAVQTVSGNADEQRVLDKCDYFAGVSIWPARREIDPRLWLDNFSTKERPHAIRLLSWFLYFSEDLVKQLFQAAVHSLSARICTAVVDDPLRAWRGFVDRLLVTGVTGEAPNPTDSAHIFQRMARQLLGLPEEQIVTPGEAIQMLLSDGSHPVLFVDDFAGSGRQFIDTWFRGKWDGQPVGASFADVAASGRGEFYYSPLICTEHGQGRITGACRGVTVSPAHILPSQYGAFAPDSLIWPEDKRSDGRLFVMGASQRAGIPDGMWRGFDGLGLTVAFAHSVPDATLPLFWWRENGWNPLKART